MTTQKQITIKLFFNRSNMMFYVQLGDMLFMIKDKIATAIQEREDLEIRHVVDIKQMQLISFEEDKNQKQ